MKKRGISYKYTERMKRRGINYEYTERETWDGGIATGYTCREFNKYPYYLKSFGTQTQEEMEKQIDFYIDNRDRYVERYDLEIKATEEYFKKQ